MQSKLKRGLTSLISSASQALTVLGLLVLGYLGGENYFYTRVAAYREIDYYAGQEALLAAEINILANQYAITSRGTNIIASGVAYAQFSEAVDNLERNHLALIKAQDRAGFSNQSAGREEQVSRHRDLFTSFVATARALMLADDAFGPLPAHESKEIISILEAVTGETRHAEQRALFSMLQFNLLMLVAAIAFMIWFWFARVRPISRHAADVEHRAQEIELRLHAEEERAKAMLQFSSDAVIAFDESGILESFNMSAETVFGYQAEEILGQPARVLISKSTPFATLENFKDFKPRNLANLANGVMLKGKRKNGEEFSARLIVNEIWSKGKRSFVANIHDLTEEIAARNQLQESLERFDLCVRGSDSAIWDFKVTDGTMFVAPRLMQLLGYDEKEAITSMSRMLQFVHPDDQETVQTRANKNMNSGSMGFESRLRLRARNGNYQWFQNKGAFRRDAKGILVRIAGSLTEITAQVHAEEELRRHRDHLVKMVDAQTRRIKKSEARLATAISGISEGLCLVDENKLIVLVNKHMLQLYPEADEILNPGVALDDVFVELLEKNKRNAPRIKFITEHFSALRSDATSQELPRQDGGWMRITRTKTEDSGEIILHTDITHYKEQEARLHAQARELEHALSMEKEVNNLHKQFVTMASHEFRTPLAIIDGSAQFLVHEAEKMSPERIAQRAEKIRGAVCRMTKLIESTLTVARLDAGKIEIAPHECDLKSLIMEVCGRQQELSPGHNFSLDLDELPDRIIADSKAMDQVMTNLCSNAVKYSPDSPAIHIYGRREGALLAVSVRDQGLGIAAEDMPKLFSRFFRAQNSTGIVGTGIGLNLVKELVTLHGGAVHVDSSAGNGSIFTIRLPIQGPHTAPLQQSPLAATA